MRSAEKSYIPDSVDRGNPRPLNEQVYDEICRAIAEKRLVPGDILPQRERLAEAFGVGVNTVRQAVERLVAEKIIVSRPRVGCQIAPDVPSFFCGKILYVLTEFSGAEEAGMKDWRGRAADVFTDQGEIAAKMKSAPGPVWYYIARRRTRR